MTANESITPTEPTGHDEAVEVVASTLAELQWFYAPVEVVARALSELQSVYAPVDEGTRIDAAEIVTALSSAGFLATEQEWAIRTESGMVLDGARDQAYAERWAAGCTNTNALTGEVRTGTAVAVSRRVGAWTEATS